MRPRKHTDRIKIWDHNRLLYYQDAATATYWDSVWDGNLNKEYYKPYENGWLGEYPHFIEFLKPDDLILEAGCGTGRYVVSLRSRGYTKITGIDFGEKTIKRVKELFPDLPVTFGDATNTGIPEKTLDGYISLGVVEHRMDGPEPFLTEAYRIVKPGGIAFISVPCVNQLRLLKGRLGFYRTGVPSNLSFYQYAFQPIEFESILKEIGFKILTTYGIAGAFGIRDEFPRIFRSIDRFPGGWMVNRWIKNFDNSNRFEHMRLFVCQRN